MLTSESSGHPGVHKDSLALVFFMLQVQKPDQGVYTVGPYVKLSASNHIRKGRQKMVSIFRVVLAVLLGSLALAYPAVI
jgi:hypothetical protein